MSFAGLKKQINKANQYVSEKMGAAEATKLDEAYNDLEKKIDVTNVLVDDFLVKTREYLQPNPASRAKMATTATISKLRGAVVSLPYPQPEGLLGDAMLKHGKALGDDSNFGRALVDAGESYKMMADVKYALEDNVKQNFLDPLTHLHNNDLKEVAHHRKKLQGRRLDYDCKQRKQKDSAPSPIIDEEIRQAEEKLEESKKLAETAMFNVLDNDVEQISQLCAFVEAQLDFHRQTAQILEALSDKLKEKIQQAANRPKQHHMPKPVLNDQLRRISRSPVPDSPQNARPQQQVAKKSDSGHSINSQDPWAVNQPALEGSWNQQAPPPYNDRHPPTNGRRQPCCKAIFDFDAENEGELSFREGQIINLIARIDENWFEGTLPSTGRSGYFPVTYVTVVVPIT